VETGEVLLVLGLCAVALYGRHIMLYLAAFIALLLWGLEIADTTSLTYGIAICCASIYFLRRSYEVWFGQ